MPGEKPPRRCGCVGEARTSQELHQARRATHSGAFPQTLIIQSFSQVARRLTVTRRSSLTGQQTRNEHARGNDFHRRSIVWRGCATSSWLGRGGNERRGRLDGGSLGASVCGSAALRDVARRWGLHSGSGDGTHFSRIYIAHRLFWAKESGPRATKEHTRSWQCARRHEEEAFIPPHDNTAVEVNGPATKTDVHLTKATLWDK